MLELNHVSFTYGGAQTVDDVSLSVGASEFVAIAGTNGAGKSTLIRLMRGLLKPTAGRVVTCGADTAQIRPSALAAKVGFLFQNPDRQLCRDNLRDELAFSLKAAGVPAAEHDARIAEALGTLSLSPDASPFAMSRGERQRAALASVLVTQPQLLLLDEPTTGLDWRECCQIMELVAARNQAGVTVIMICHDMELVLDYAKRVVVMHHGRILGDGTPAEVFRSEALLASASLLPPQIIGLTNRLGRYHDAVTPDALADRILAERGAKS